MRGEAPSARLAAGPGPGWLRHIVYRLANRQILPKPDSSSHAWALPVQLFQHLFLLKCIYYAERNRTGAGAEASGAPLRASFGNNCVGEKSAALGLATTCPGHRSQGPGDIGSGREADGERTTDGIRLELGSLCEQHGLGRLSEPLRTSVPSSVKWERGRP